MIQTYPSNERPGGGVLDAEFATAESADDQLARVLGLVLDGLLQTPR